MKKRVVHERGKNISYIESVFYSLITKTTVHIKEQGTILLKCKQKGY